MPEPKDLLGVPGNNSCAMNLRDKSCRDLQTIAVLREAITKKGGQPK